MPRGNDARQHEPEMTDSNVTVKSSAHATRPLPDGGLPELPLAASPPLGVTWGSTVSAGSGSGVRLEVHGELGAVAEQWKAFERAADRTAFQSFGWLAAWQHHIGEHCGTRPAIILGYDADGGLLFILPLAIEVHEPLRRLVWLGSALCDYNAPLLAEHFSDRMSAERFLIVWRDVIVRLRGEPQFRFDLLDLQKMPPAMGAQRNPFLDLVVHAHPSGAYVADLGRSWDELYAARRSAATRKRERRQLRHLAEHGEVRFDDVRGSEAIAGTLATLIEQKSRAFARMGVEDLFARPGYRDFFHAVAGDPELRGMVHVSRLDVGATIAATSVGLTFRDCYYLILSSYADGELARFGPGRAHLHELIRQAIANGLRRFDFTIGDEPYKRDWSDEEVCLYDHLAAVTVRGFLAVALTAAFRRAKRTVKQSPTLWPAFSRARALVGSLGAR